MEFSVNFSWAESVFIYLHHLKFTWIKWITIWTFALSYFEINWAAEVKKNICFFLERLVIYIIKFEINLL